MLYEDALKVKTIHGTGHTHYNDISYKCIAREFEMDVYDREFILSPCF